MNTHTDTTGHPLTETAAAELWDTSRDPGRPAADRHEEMHHDERATAVTAIRAAFDLGREYERERLADPHHDTRPTPPAKEVELPDEPCVLTDVQIRETLAAGVTLWTGLEVVVAGSPGRAVVMRIRDLTAFTLPDGTRARRDGEHEDGRPRFVEDDQ